MSIHPGSAGEVDPPGVEPGTGGEARLTDNILAKVPVEHQAEVQATYWAILDPTGEPPGDTSIVLARQRAGDFSVRFGGRFPSAVACLNDDLTSLFSYLCFPVEHHKRIRHSNFVERTSGESRRRVKVIGRLPGERSCLGLVWAVLDRAGRSRRGVTMTPATVRQLQELRRQLLHPDTPTRAGTIVDEAVTAAAEYHHEKPAVGDHPNFALSDHRNSRRPSSALPDSECG